MRLELNIAGIAPEKQSALLNVKDYDQYVRTVQTLQSGICPFCQIDRNFNKVLYENNSWRIWRSVFPQRNQDLHLVIPNVRHLGHISELSEEDWRDLGDINRWACENFELPGGGFALRFGDPALHAGSIPDHLHVNIQIPSGEGLVSVILHKDNDEIDLQYQRVLVYEKLRTGTPYAELSTVENAFIWGRYPKLVTT